MKKKIILIILFVIIFVGLYFIGYFGMKAINEYLYRDRVTEILADDKEIERKWLIKEEDIPYNLKKDDVEVYDIQQTYLCFDPEMRVRNYNNGEAYEYTMKTNMTKDGLVRDEVNIDINKEQYDN